MLSLIVAVSKNGVIGRQGDLPWHQSADLKRFKQLTMGHHLIMGRKTFESLGRALPGRTSIVLSRQADIELPAGVLLAHDLQEAERLCGDDPEPFVIGGAEVFRLALARSRKLYLTRIEADVEGDTMLPELDLAGWRLIHEEHVPADDRNDFPTTFQVYERP